MKGWATTVRPGATTRVHLDLRPETGADAHWNNEAEGLVVWLDPPRGWQVVERRVDLPPAPTPVSDEPRHVEFELQSPDDASGTVEVAGYALYYVCEGVKGACLYRRQDLSLSIEMARDVKPN